MKRKDKIIIGSRGSELALWQTNFVKREIEKNNRNVKVEIKIIATRGDKMLDLALSKIGDKNLFTKELEVQLLERKIDLAVHSLKDMQTSLPKGLKIAAVTKRHAVEDVLIARRKGITLYDLQEGAKIGTGSLRRKCQLLHLRPDIKTLELRGNVPTRINKFLNSDWDGIILARAGVERLRMNKFISSYISTDEFLPAVGQGALAIETHEDNLYLDEILQPLQDSKTYDAITAERSLLKTLEGGCQVPIGAYAEVRSNGLYLDAMVGSLDGTITFRKKIRGSRKRAEQTGKQLAKHLLKAGAKSILNDIYNQMRRT